MATTAPPDLLVVGGGAIGLAIAWRAARRGMAVSLLERDGTGEGTSRVAAGMLAPVAEVEFGGAGRRMLDLAMRSAALWPGFASGAAGAPRGTRSCCAPPARCCSRATATRRPSSSASSSSAARSASTSGGCARARRGSSSRRSRRRCARRSRHPMTTRSTRDRCCARCETRVSRRGCELREHAPLVGVDHDGERRCGRRSSRAASALPAGAVVLAAGPVERRARGAAGRGARAGAAGQGPDPAAARPRGARAAGTGRALRGRLRRAARGRPLRARRAPSRSAASS